jgi:hypothetical protein
LSAREEIVVKVASGVTPPSGFPEIKEALSASILARIYRPGVLKRVF